MNRGLVVVSNRLPVRFEAGGSGRRLQPSGGGLVSALSPILRANGGCWVGSPEVDYREDVIRAFEEWTSNECYSLEPVFLTSSERDGFYRGYSNEIIWPLFHGMTPLCLFSPEYWDRYCTANARFADVVERVARSHSLIWVHDYHLMLLADALRYRGAEHRLAYFHHIPFPSPDTFEILPWRVQVLRALLQFDVLGFQTVRDQHNFVSCLRRCVPDVRVTHAGKVFTAHGSRRTVTVGAYPISIDYEDFCAVAGDWRVEDEVQAINEALPDQKLILGVDRLDYTKGIIERLAAFKLFLEDNPEFRERATLLQIIVPSREEIPEYRALRSRIEMLISSINGDFGSRDWVPIRYFHRQFPRWELAALYRAAHVAMITPLKDGMNLVAKEFCASRVDGRGALVLSEFAGASHELGAGAFLVNPRNTIEVARVLKQALFSNAHELRIRMNAMRSQIRSNDVFHWARAFVGACDRELVAV